MDRNFYIYKHTTLDTQEVFYVGKGFKRRAWETRSRNSFWHNIVRKHGYTVELIFTGLSEQDALLKEIDCISEFKKLNLCRTNLTLGGEGISGFVHSSKTRLKISQVHKGKKLSLETRQKQSMAMSGKIRTMDMYTSQTGQLNCNWKGFVHTPYGVFETTKLASTALDIPQPTIAHRCRNKKLPDWFYKRTLNG